MHNREMKSVLATLVGSLCLAAAAYAASGSASGSSTTTPSASGTVSGQAGSATGTTGSAATATGTQATGAQAGTQGAAASGTAMSEKYTDGEIVATVLAIDENEIKAGQAAEKKKMGKEATRFAKMLVKEHRADSTKVSKVAKKENITPAENAAKAQELRDKGASELQTLSAKDSLEFEQGFINAMVQGHTDALALIDDHLLKDAENKKLKNQLEETRKHVSEHLEHAKRLQGARASR